MLKKEVLPAGSRLHIDIDNAQDGASEVHGAVLNLEALLQALELHRGGARTAPQRLMAQCWFEDLPTGSRLHIDSAQDGASKAHGARPDLKRLLQALELHREGAQDGLSEAHDAVLGVLQCLHALTSSGPGMETLMQTGEALRHLMSLLDPDDSDASRLVVEMLTTLCLFSDQGYCSVLQVRAGSMGVARYDSRWRK